MSLFPIPILFITALIIGGCTVLQSNRTPSILNESNTPTPSVVPLEADITSVSFRVEEYAKNLSVPWSIIFTSPTRLLVSQRNGEIRAIENGTQRQTLIHRLSDVSARSEEGLMGMTMDPNYSINNYIYVCYAYETKAGIADRIVRFNDDQTQFSSPVTILDGIPAAQFHAGCRIKFGPDGKLYITTGDATDKQIAQDPQSLGGKILRLNADGSIPTDNPIPNSPVFSLGHRNPQGIDWHPESLTLIATEHGPSGNDGPGGGDEINQIIAGKNYGWPLVSHEKTDTRFITPLRTFTPAIAPASGMFYSGRVFSAWKNHYFFGMLRGAGIMIASFNSEGTAILSAEKLPQLSVGRVRDVIEGPDGFIYFTTSNRDGRGRPRIGDDRIYRIVPSQE